MQSDDLRSALAHFVTGVTIITARNEAGEPIGVTANSFNSVSLDPPLILWSVANRAFSCPSFLDSKHFAVNILAANQVTLSNKFATQSAKKFDGVDWQDGIGGIPLIDNCSARFECQTEHLYPGGDHTIIVGRVVDFHVTEREPLAYHRGGYATAVAMPRESISDIASPKEFRGFTGNFLIYLLARARHQMSAEFYEKVERSGLGVMKWRVLASLLDEKTCDLPVLADRTLMDMKSLADLLIKMQGEELLNFDLSSNNVSITIAGETQASELVDIAVKFENSVLTGISEKDVERLKETLRQIIVKTNH